MNKDGTAYIYCPLCGYTENFKDKNIAVIETPDERYWSLSVLKYLNECDQFFPDVLTEALKKGDLPLKGYFSPLSTKIH